LGVSVVLSELVGHPDERATNLLRSFFPSKHESKRPRLR
jgi:hypothetical protein